MIYAKAKSKLADTFQNIFSLLLQDTINLLHYWDYNKKGKDENNLAKELMETGYVEVPGFLSEAECDKLYREVTTIAASCKQNTKLDNGAFVHFRGNAYANDPDKGMIDIYNIERALDIKIDYEAIEKIIRPTTTCDLYFTSIHAYINRGITGTRVAHVDNCQPVVFKAFIYLVDVPTKDYGPYSFVDGTHRFSIQVYWNLVRNLFIKKYRSTDAPVFKKNKEIFALGKKGTLIISNQNGIHRGNPQTPDKERVALVLTYMVISKLNYLHATAKQTLAEALKKF